MSGLSHWMQHRMVLLDLAGPQVLAEQADLAEETVARLLTSDSLDSLQQSQHRRLSCGALQVSLATLTALADGRLDWIDDADRYSPFSFGPAGDPAGKSEPTRVRAGPREARQATPLLGRVDLLGRIETDDCWDEQWGPRLADGQPQHRDTYALECRGTFLVVRNVNPWEAHGGAIVAVYLCDDADGIAYFGQLASCTPGQWAWRRVCRAQNTTSD